MAANKTLEAIVSIAGQLDPSLQKSLAGATKQFKGLKIGVAAVGTAAVAATAALVKFTADSVKSAAEFETQMANVATLLDGTQAQISKRIGELGDDVLAVSNKTGVASDDLTDGLYQIISAVGDSEDAIKQMEISAKAASAGGSTTTDAINLLTAVTKGYGDTSEEAFQKASDLSFMTVKLGQTSFPELASSMGKVVPLSSALGVAQEDLYGAFATLTGVTGSTAEVSTQLKAVMSGLMSPTKQMDKALKSLGYANANAAIETLGLQGTFNALQDSVGGDTQAFAKLFSSVEAQTAILALGGAQAEDFTKKTQAMYEASGATDEAFGRATDTLEYQIQMIKNLGKNFMTNVGRQLLPIVKDVAETLLPLVASNLEAISPIVSKIFDKISPLITKFGEFAQNLMPIFTAKLEAGIQLFEEMEPTISSLAEQVFPIFEDVLNTVFEIWNQLQPVISDTVKQVFPLLQQILLKIGDVIQSILPSVSEFAMSLIPAISTVIEALIPIICVLFDAISPILDMIVPLVNSLLPALTSIINILVPIIQLVASVVTDVLANAFSFLLPIVQNVIDVLVNICDFISNIFTANWSSAWENVKNIFSNAFQALIGLCKAPINAIISIINGAISGINKCGFTIPDWVPVVGGKAFSIDIPQIPMLATGGFTTGPSIAGEAGQEAVISFDSAYRDENLSYWARAGRLLGVDDRLLTAFENGGTTSGTTLNVTFAPNITINGSGKDKDDIVAAIRREEEEFMDMLEDMLDRRGGDSYGFSY